MFWLLDDVTFFRVIVVPRLDGGDPWTIWLIDHQILIPRVWTNGMYLGVCLEGLVGSFVIFNFAKTTSYHKWYVSLLYDAFMMPNCKAYMENLFLAFGFRSRALQ